MIASVKNKLSWNQETSIERVMKNNKHHCTNASNLALIRLFVVISVVVLLVLFLSSALSCAVEQGGETQSGKFTHTHSSTGFIKGHSWGWTGWRGQYLGDGPVDSMKKLADTGANWVCISFGGEMEEPNKPEIFFADTNPRMATDDEIRRAIELARENKLKVILNTNPPK